METSLEIHELASALAKAQGDIAGAAKTSINPFFKSKYASLASVWDACRGPLTTHGLSVVQSPTTEGLRVSLDTLLLHASGQWIRSTVSVNAKEDSPQAVGSCISYLRRYALQSVVGVAPDEDDDGEAAEGRKNGNGKAAQPTPTAIATPPKGYADWYDDLRAAGDEGTERLRKAWESSKPEYRTYLTTNFAKQWDALKAHAAKVSEPVSA